MSSENDPLPELANLQISENSKRPNARTRRKKKKQNEAALNEIASRLTLRQFSCPFLDEFGTCVYDELPHRCQFSHPELVKPGETLMKIPFYVCVFHLIHICNFRPRSKKKKNSLQFGSRNHDEDDEYFYCNYGYHLKLPEMHDFQYKRPDLIVDLFGSDLELVCSICELKVMEKCFPRNRRFGLLENCFDIFCATCLIKHRRDDPDNKECPVCGEKSARMANHRCFVGSVYTKAKIFADGQPATTAASASVSEIQNNNTEPKNGSKTLEKNSNSTTPEPPSAELLPRPPKSLAASTLLVPSTLTSAPSSSKIAQTGSGSSSRRNSKTNNANQCQICKQTITVTSNGGQQLSQQEQESSECLFVMLENCSHHFCVDCIEKERKRSGMKCPICKLTSRRMVAHSKYVPPGTEKTKLFAKLNGTHGKKSSVTLETTAKEISSSSTTTTGQSRNLLCRICNRKVHSNPDNPNHKYGILENCWHVFCSTCINAKREEKEYGPRCPICSIVSERIYYRLEYVQSEDEKQKLFARLQNTKKTIKGVLMTNSSPQSSTSSDRSKSNGSVVESKPSTSSSSGIFPNVADSQRICGICNLRVLSNPKNQDNQFGILENCEHVFCSSCIQPKRFLSPQCPVCKLTSRIVYHPSFFVSNDAEKRQLFAKLKKSNKNKVTPVSSRSQTPASPTIGTRFDCRMCRCTFNIVPGGDQFVCLLENCSHIFCMQCICTESPPFHCRECGVGSERFSIQSRLGFSEQEKLQIFQDSKRVDNFF